MHNIREVTGIAHEIGVEPGDMLISLQGQKVQDVLDYRFMVAEDSLIMEIQKPNGDIWELDIEKDVYDDLGLTFESSLMDEMRRCHNHCIFCFMNQLPKGMRPSLYIKDDDPRLSFLSGNYVTLTNTTMEEAKRIARYHLSPLHISIHAADSNLRRQMLNNEEEGNIFDYLHLFNKAGIMLHFQIVLCKGINDEKALDETISALLELQPGAVSLSVVPVGLTRHREGLYHLLPFDKNDAEVVLQQIAKWQEYCKAKYGTAFVFASDEWYLKAGHNMPAYEHYEDFPQLENGVGMCALFEYEFMQELKELQEMGNLQRLKKGNGKEIIVGIITGTAAQALIERLVNVLMEKLAHVIGATAPLAKIHVYAVKNHFFGELVNVSGLLTGQDIIAQVREQALANECKALFLPRNILRAETTTLLDDTTVADLENAIGIPVHVGDTDGFVAQLIAVLYSDSYCISKTTDHKDGEIN